MSTFAASQAPPPKGWDEFEDLVCSAAKNRWKTPNFTRHGRQGQAQSGVDVYGTDAAGALIGLQCKNTIQGVAEKTVKAEVLNAEAFKPSLNQVFIATTAKTDEGLQEFVRLLSEARKKAGKFEVGILFWNDLWQDLALNHAELFKHYPELRPTAPGPTKDDHDRALFSEFQRTLPYEPTLRFLKDHDFGASFYKATVDPLFDFVEVWNQPDKEFLDEKLRAEFVTLFAAAQGMAYAIAQRTVPIGLGTGMLSVYPDAVRAQGGPRPDWIVADAGYLNKTAIAFVPIYEGFIRTCKARLFS